MKKRILLLGFCALNLLSNAQVIDFENVPLNPNAFYNGSTGNSYFQNGNVTFENVYVADPMYPYWSGFAISNVQDDQTAGYGNQYAAYSGSGHQSNNYAVFYSAGTITFTQNVIVDSFFVTNTTYTGLSMKDGDVFAKQFGSIYGPDGVTVDGTNGADSLILYIYRYDGSTNLIDSLAFALADYRFSNNTQDYIIKNWTKISFNDNKAVSKLDFKLYSSDNGAWGMNTPAYFALDDLHTNPFLDLTETKNTKLNVFPNPVNEVLYFNQPADQIEVIDQQGKTLLSFAQNGVQEINLSTLNAGVYFIRFEYNNQIQVIKINKL